MHLLLIMHVSTHLFCFLGMTCTFIYPGFLSPQDFLLMHCSKPTPLLFLLSPISLPPVSLSLWQTLTLLRFLQCPRRSITSTTTFGSVTRWRQSPWLRPSTEPPRWDETKWSVFSAFFFSFLWFILLKSNTCRYSNNFLEVKMLACLLRKLVQSYRWRNRNRLCQNV